MPPSSSPLTSHYLLFLSSFFLPLSLSLWPRRCTPMPGVSRGPSRNASVRASPGHPRCRDANIKKFSSELRDSVPKNLTNSDMQKDVQRVSKSNISSTTKVQKKTVGNAQTPTDICSGVSKGRSTAEVNSAKTPAVQSGSASMTKEKKHIVVEQLTIAAFLQKLGLSKYLIAFQAEEVDMFALKHMNNDDLRSIGLPMGPRKKILLALAAAKAKK